MPDTIEPTGDDALYAYITFESGAAGQWIDDHAGHGAAQERAPGLRIQRAPSRRSATATASRAPSISTTAPSIDDARILEYAPSYRLNPLMAELFGGERVWTYDFTFNEVDAKIIASEYFELGECIRTGAAPEVTGEEGRADVALTYAPFESGRLGRPVTLDDMLARRAYVYQGEIDEILGLATAPPILA